MSGSEIVDISLQFYDTLIANEKGFSPVVKSGYIKCRFSKLAPRYDSSLLYNQKEYKKDRKTYLEERCVNEGGLYHIRLFDKNNWHDGIFGDIIAYKDSEVVVLSFQANRTYGTADKNYHTVMLPNVTKQVFEKIDLDFENCDSFEIFQEEILDIQINCKKQLEWNSSSYGREISNGFMEFRDNDILYTARAWCENANYWTVYFDVMNAIKPTFEKSGIEFTYPHMNVHMVENKAVGNATDTAPIFRK